jgi:hypothetical protein
MACATHFSLRKPRSKRTTARPKFDYALRRSSAAYQLAKGIFMAGKILRRCSLCGKFHAAYLVPEHHGRKGYYCYACWKATQAARPLTSQVDTAAPSEADEHRQGLNGKEKNM